MISIKHKFIFIHYPKTGGNSLQEVLRLYSEDKIIYPMRHQDGLERFDLQSDFHNISKHSNLREYKYALPANLFSSMYKFTTIRNPWDRMISFYFSPHRRVTVWNRNEFLALVSDVRPLRSFVKIDNKGQPLNMYIDELLRFENLETDFKRACEKIDIDYKPLVKRNASTRQHYSAYYDNELIELVRSKFEEEIVLGEYRFESKRSI